MKNARRSTHYIRLAYELLFSIHCAFLVVAREDLQEGSVLLDKLQTPLLSLERLLANLLHRAVFTNDRRNLVFGSWWLLAVIIFVGVRALGRIVPIRNLLCHVVGVVAVVGPPFCYFFMTIEGHLSTGAWLKLEVAVIVACVLLYLYRRWPINAAFSILTLLLHYGLWGLVIWGPTAWRDYLWQMTATLVLPFCTSLAWGYYVRFSAGPDPPARPLVV